MPEVRQNESSLAERKNQSTRIGDAIYPTGCQSCLLFHIFPDCKNMRAVKTKITTHSLL